MSAFSLLAVGGALFLLWLSSGCKPQAESDESFMASYEQQLKIEAKAREADPAWKPATENVATIQGGDRKAGGKLQNFCLNTNGNIFACLGSSTPRGKDDSAQIKVFSPDGKLLESWPLPSTPEAICVNQAGAIFVGGAGRILRLGQNGKVLTSADSPAVAAAVYQKMLQGRQQNVTGIAVTGEDLFVACPSVSDFTYSVYRLDRDLKNSKLIVKGLHGCCGQMDVQARDGKLWVPHNARHLVECYDRDGKKLSSFGRTDRKAADGFGGCCEPKNLRLGTDGNIYAAESGPPVAIKRFSPEGKFGGVVALPAFSSGCVRVTVEVSPDCRRFYILDTGADSIHVFAAKN